MRMSVPFKLRGHYMDNSGHILHQSDLKALIAAYCDRKVELWQYSEVSGHEQKKRDHKLCLCSLLSSEVYQGSNG